MGSRLLVLVCLLVGARAAAENRAVVFVIDRALTAERIEVVREAFKEVEFHEGDRVGIVAFGKTGQVVRSIAGGPSKSRIVPTTEPTNVDAGLETAQAMARRVRGPRLFVIVSDGASSVNELVVAPKQRDVASLQATFQRLVDGVPAEDAYVLVIDRALFGPKLEAAKELARQRADALSPRAYVGVIAFEATPTTYVRMQRAANRMRIANDISRINYVVRGTDTTAALRHATSMLDALVDVTPHVVLFGSAARADSAVVTRMKDAGISVEIIDLSDSHKQSLRMR